MFCMALLAQKLMPLIMKIAGDFLVISVHVFIEFDTFGIYSKAKKWPVKDCH